MAGRIIVGELTPQTNAWLDQIVTDAKNRVAPYERFERYYDGDHNIKLTHRAKKYLEASGFRYAHNFCERIVDAVTDNLIVSGVTVKVTPAATATAATPTQSATVSDATTELDVSDNADPGAALTAWLEEHLDEIGFDEIATVVHHDAVEKGDGYAQAYYDADNERPEIAYESPKACVPKYRQGRPHQLEYVAKTWEDEQPIGDGTTTLALRRVTVYFADRIEKYVQPDGQKWAKWWDSEDGLENPDDADSGLRWPVPWVRAATPDAEPDARGLPVAHFRNKARGKRYGKSELRTALPQQDALNKRMIDLDLVNDSQGYAQRWATGVQSTAKLKGHAGSIWSTAKDTAKFGQFPAADPKGLLSTIDSAIQHLAGTTATPVHSLLIIGAIPSGEALKTAESPYVRKMRRKQSTFGRNWADILLQVILIAIDHELVKVDGIDDAKITVEVHWESAETRNEKEHWEVQNLKQTAGVSQHTTLQEDGYDGTQERALRAAETQATTAAITAAVNRGDELEQVTE